MIFYSALIVCALITGIFIIKKLPPLYSLICPLHGIAALIAADVMLSLYSQNMPINALTLAVSAFGGIPGVILLVLLKTFYG